MYRVVIWRVTYFQFPIQSAFLPCRKPGSCSGVRGLPNVGHRTLPKMWEVRSFCVAYSPGGKDYELIITVKIETRYPVEGYFGNEFREISNDCAVSATWSYKVWKFCEQFFLKKRPLTLQFSKFCSESLHGDTYRRCCVQISWNVADGKSVKSCVLYRTIKKTKFRLPFKLSLLRGSRPKSARASLQ